MSDIFTRKNIYGVGLVIVPISILVFAFTKTSFKLTSDTFVYAFFNPFWAVFIIIVDKFFVEKLQSNHDELKTKIDKIKGMVVTEEKKIESDNIRLVLTGKDEEISVQKVKNLMDKQISKTDPIKKLGPVNLNYD